MEGFFASMAVDSMPYVVYILHSAHSDVYYKGVTNNLEKRLFEHNNHKSRYTKNKGSWELVYACAYSEKRDALIEELRIKKLNRRSLEKLIANYQKDNSVG